MIGRSRYRAALLILAVCVGGGIAAVASPRDDDRVLHLVISTMLTPSSGRALTGGMDEIWIDWRSGVALSQSILPGETTTSVRWYRRIGGRFETLTRQVDGSIASDSGQSPWDGIVLERAAAGLSGLRTRYTALLRAIAPAPLSHRGAHAILLHADRDLLPAPLPGPVMQRGTTVWLDTRTHLPTQVERALLPYLGGTDETEVCRIVALDEIPRSAAPPDLTGPPQPSPWGHLANTLIAVLRRAHL